MKIAPVTNNHIEVETEKGHSFSIYGLVGGGIEIHPQLPGQEIVGEILHNDQSKLEDYDSINRVTLRIKGR